jgi:hypothetical protein
VRLQAGTADQALGACGRERIVSVFDAPYNAVSGVVDPAQRITNAAALQAAIESVAAKGGGAVSIEASRFEFIGTIRAKAFVAVRGLGKDHTVLGCYTKNAPNAVALDLKGSGTGSYPEDRIITCWSGFTLDMTHADDKVHGVRLGHNHRSFPLLRDVRINGSGGHGIWLDANNWIISLENIEINQCGRTDGAGLYATPSITDINDFTLRQVNIEGCGGPGSVAGGIDARFAGGTNRGWVFHSLNVEGCAGRSEGAFRRVNAMTINGFYHERTNGAGREYGIEFDDCMGIISGGTMSAETGSPHTALVFKGGARFEIQGVAFSNWRNGAIAALEGAHVRACGNTGVRYLNDGTGQILGDYQPAFHAHKNGTDQPVPAGALAKVTFGTTAFDETDAFGASAFRPLLLGLYQMDVQLSWPATGQDVLTLAIYRNGALECSNQLHTAAVQGEVTHHFATAVRIEAVTDVIEIYAGHAAASAKRILGNRATTWLKASFMS